VRQLQACSCGALSLTRGRVCRLPGEELNAYFQYI
jgi:hypothetical protein